MLYISFNYRELHRLKEAVFAPHMVNAGQHSTPVGTNFQDLLAFFVDLARRDGRKVFPAPHAFGVLFNGVECVTVLEDEIGVQLGSTLENLAVNIQSTLW